PNDVLRVWLPWDGCSPCRAGSPHGSYVPGRMGVKNFAVTEFGTVVVVLLGAPCEAQGKHAVATDCLLRRWVFAAWNLVLRWLHTAPTFSGNILCCSRAQT